MVPHGRGIKVDIAGKQLFEGWFRNGKVEGRVRRIANDPAGGFIVQTGEFKNDLASGMCTVKWPSGQYFHGSIQNGKRNGFGFIRYKDGVSFMGIWKDDQREGYGEMAYPNGIKLKGNWVNHKKEGMFKVEQEDALRGQVKTNIVIYSNDERA
ncbi:hypothetical protein FGO68_gene1272 [Halteria grandinella]|uniref:Uncharacterized protein n=1 Tax=Halteria grandinella TaxID=5974 RepID=A0A8J8NQ06_HALGN|nr:hypothetical protein FGO68_gene1272 [Halteria grandinella]